MDLALLQSTLAAAGEPAFRARQVWAWTARGAVSYEQMTDLPLGLRTHLAEAVPFSSLTVEHEAQARDGTVKALFTPVTPVPWKRCSCASAMGAGRCACPPSRAVR